ncbi:MAG: hypothetical protein LBI11_07180 [Streptococcaceae bacterium]|nr:hypothetical protein [Streptococcaceae bacterium]
MKIISAVFAGVFSVGAILAFLNAGLVATFYDWDPDGNTPAQLKEINNATNQALIPAFIGLSMAVICWILFVVCSFQDKQKKLENKE